MAGRLTGKVALVTGAAQGIGERIAERFAAEGAIVLATDINETAVQALAARLGAPAIGLALDVTVPEQWTVAVERATALFGRLDVLVANAGVAGFGLIETMDRAAHQKIIDINLNGTFYGMQTVIPAMRASGGGSIVNMASIDGMVGVAGLTSYVGSKFAVRGMTRAAAIELGSAGIRVNAVFPGVIDTPLIQPGIESGKVAEIIARQPIARLGTPDDVASMVLFLASDESSYCTGGEYAVDGGQLAGPVRG